MNKSMHLTLTLLVVVAVGALLIFLRNSKFWDKLGTSNPEPGLNLFGQQLIGKPSSTVDPTKTAVGSGGPAQGTAANLTKEDINAIATVGYPAWSAAHNEAVTTGGQPGYVFPTSQPVTSAG